MSDEAENYLPRIDEIKMQKFPKTKIIKKSKKSKKSKKTC